MPEADVGDDEGEVVATTAESEDGAEEAEAGKEASVDAERHGVGGIFGKVEDGDEEDVEVHLLDEPGAKEADEETEGGSGKSSEGEAFHQALDEDKEACDEEATEDSGPDRDGVTGGNSDADSRNFADHQEDEAGDIDWGGSDELFHVSC